MINKQGITLFINSNTSVIPLAQYNFKTTDKEITEYLDSQNNVSKAIKEAIKLKQLHDLNPIQQPEIKELENLELEL